MTVHPVPTLTVAGVSVATGPAADGSAPPLRAIDKLRVPWGRRSLLDQPTPATCTVSVLDTSTGATFARRTDLKGQPVVIGWTVPGGSSGVTFRGRVTDVAVLPRSAGKPGFRVTLSCSSREVDAANYTAPEGTSWPAETMSARLARIVALLPAGYFPGGIQMPDRNSVGLTDVADPTKDFADYPAAAASVGGQDVLSLLRELWRSLYPVPLLYDPDTDGLLFIRSRLHAFDGNVGGTIVGQLVPSPAAGGRYVVTPYTYLSLSLDSQLVPLAGPLSQPLEAGLTRVEVKYTNPTTGQAATAAASVTGAPAETVSGRRTLSVDSILADAGLAGQLAAQWARIAGQVALPALADPITYRPTKSGGFADENAAAVLLAGRERPAEVYLGRSWVTRLGVRPLFGLIGGVITYAGGEWELQCQTAPVTVDAPLATPIHNGTAAANRIIKVTDIDRSVAVEDLRHVHIGAGYSYSTQPWGQ